MCEVVEQNVWHEMAFVCRSVSVCTDKDSHVHRRRCVYVCVCKEGVEDWCAK